MFNAFAESKRQYLAKLKGGQIEKPTEIDKLHQRVMEITGDPLPYGIAPNRKVLEELIRHATMQGIVTMPVSVDELFAPSTRGLVGLDAMPDTVPTHRLTEEASLKMLAAGVAKANALGCKVSLAVVDASCRMIAFLMMDGARHFSIITTQRKAITSASQRMPTGYAPEENALSMAVRMGDFTNVPGGFPIEVGGEVIGAVAAGGAKIEQDVEVAKAALAALADARTF